MDTSKTGSGPRRRTPEQRQRLLAGFHQSQLTQQDSATRHGIGLTTLGKWLRLERDAVPAKVKFQEVRLPKATWRWPVEAVSLRGRIVRLQNENRLLRQKLDQYIRHDFGGKRNEGLDKHQLELRQQGFLRSQSAKFNRTHCPVGAGS